MSQTRQVASALARPWVPHFQEGPMAGQIKAMIDQIIAERSQGNAVLASTTSTKLILKGLDPSKYGADSPDDPQIIEKLRQVAAEFSVTLH